MKINNEPPYLIETVVTKHLKYNRKYGNDRLCQCGHTYYRHFDSWDDMENVGCKYCPCCTFIEADVSPERIAKILSDIQQTEEGRVFVEQLKDDIASNLVNSERYNELLLEYHFEEMWKREIMNMDQKQ